MILKKVCITFQKFYNFKSQLIEYFNYLTFILPMFKYENISFNKIKITIGYFMKILIHNVVYKVY